MKFGIVGLGRFGQLWANSLLPFGEVVVYDKSDTHLSSESAIKITSLQEVTQADVLFILVPISEFEKSCLEIKKLLNPTTLVVDCCSVKLHPVEVMQRVFLDTQPLLATHPLFGPDSVKKNGGIAGHNIVICPTGPQGNKQSQLQSIFHTMGLTILTTTPEEHDRQMAHSQGLVHFLGRGLQALDLHHQELATPDFKALVNINNMVAHDTWQLFLDMHQHNPFATEMRHKLINQLINIDQSIEEPTMLTIEQLRRKIEQGDGVIIETLAKRKELSKQIGQLKSNDGRDIVDHTREKELFELYENLSEKYHLQQTFVKELFKLIIAYSRSVQEL